MKKTGAPYIRISSVFIKSILLLVLILFLPNMFIISQVFNTTDLEFNIDKYEKIISANIKEDLGNISLTRDGENLILKEKLWIQFVDSSLNEVYSFNKPHEIPSSYTPINFIDAYKNDINKSTVFIFEKEIGDLKYSYFLGFPRETVNKHNITFNPKNVKKLIKNLVVIFIINVITILAFAYLYFSKKLGRPMQEIINYIYDLSKGNFDIKAKSSNLYKEIFKCLDDLRNTLKENKEKKELLDKSREKWISYISHDMKTPLSSIKGFAELLKEDGYVFSEQEMKEYCTIIYEKSLYMEELINDLNLSYKIKNSAISLNLENINLVIFLKELIDELLSDPKFCEKNILFKSKSENINTLADRQLIKRALSNLIINFLIYNDKDAKITLEISEDINFISIIIKDNGRGISKEEVDNIFEQYFRGTNTTSNPNGSGLGMAIANELITLHNGKCFIESEKGIGTTLKVILSKDRHINSNVELPNKQLRYE